MTTRPSKLPGETDAPPASAEDGHAVAQDINWMDFRDHLATADQSGRRLWLYPRQPQGKIYRYRSWVSYFLLLVLFVGPFVRINGNPLLMFNIVERRFSIFGQVFWPQDMFYFALFMLVVFVMIVIGTAVYGRIWCGWLCPQTVLMEMVFRKIEYFIEGDYLRQQALDRAPWNREKILKKGAKWLVFFVFSFIVGNLLLAYVIGSDGLIEIVTDDPRNHVKGLTVMCLFTLMFFGIFARFREQACTFICPYGRFQSVLLDEGSIVVAYDHKRGERRGTWKRSHTPESRVANGMGSCVNCNYCVDVCPTGIDIRNGTQMECVNCTACIDACDSVMDRLRQPRGLIRFASMNDIERGEKLKLTPRLMIYSVVLVILASLLGYMLASRADVEVTLRRTPGALFQEMPNGNISNLYLLKLRNRIDREIPLELKLEEVDGAINIAGTELIAAAQDITESAAVVELPRDAIPGTTLPIRIGVYQDGKRVETLKTNFLAPGRAHE